MNGPPSGFHNAPATRAFLLVSAVITIAFGVQGRSLRLGLSYQDLSEKFHIWRIFTSVFAFSSTPELMFGLCLLYYFRVFERQISSNKYMVFLLFSLIVSSLSEILALVLLKDSTLSLLASGPYGLIFSSFVPFYFNIPVTSRFRIFGLHFSDKSFIYMAGLQVIAFFGISFVSLVVYLMYLRHSFPFHKLLLSSWTRSIIPGICGLFAGSLYYMNAFGIRSIKFPESVASFFSRFFSSSLTSSSRSSSGGNIMGNISPYVGRPVQQSYPSTAHSRAPPSEASIATLVSMGFDRNAARQALIQAGNDFNVATNILLEASSR